jgi:fatty acid desaturase
MGFLHHGADIVREMNRKSLPTTLGTALVAIAAVALTIFVVSRWDRTLPPEEAWPAAAFIAGVGIALLPGPFLIGCLWGARIEARMEREAEERERRAA